MARAGAGAAGTACQLQLFDFGMARSCGAPAGLPGSQGRMMPRRPPRMAPVGKPYYISPESHNNEACDALAQDVWASGIVFLIVLAGRPLWGEAHRRDGVFRYVQAHGVAALLAHSVPHLAPDVAALLVSLLQIDDQLQRPSAQHMHTAAAAVLANAVASATATR